MKHAKTLSAREQLVILKRELEITEKKLDYTSDPKLIAALSYELLGLKSRIGYVIDSEKQLAINI